MIILEFIDFGKIMIDETMEPAEKTDENDTATLRDASSICDVDDVADQLFRESISSLNGRTLGILIGAC